MAAFSSINIRGKMMQLYNRRVNEPGKIKMSTINIIRSKILHRVFAVLKRGTPYVDLFRFAAKKMLIYFFFHRILDKLQQQVGASVLISFWFCVSWLKARTTCPRYRGKFS